MADINILAEADKLRLIEASTGLWLEFANPVLTKAPDGSLSIRVTLEQLEDFIESYFDRGDFEEESDDEDEDDFEDDEDESEDDEDEDEDLWD